MKRTILVVLFIFCDIFLNAQEMPYKMGPLPVSTQFIYAGKIEVFENSETVIYNVNVNKNSALMSIATEGLPTVLLVPKNPYGGGELYRKLEDGDYVRIIECRKNGGTIDIYKIDEDNTSSKIFSVKADEDVAGALMVGYRLYWSNLHEQLFSNEAKVKFKTLNNIKVPINGFEVSLDKEITDLGLSFLMLEKEEELIMITSDANENIKNIEDYSNYINEKNLRNIGNYGFMLKLIKRQTGLFKGIKSINENYIGLDGTEELSVKSITFKIGSYFYSIFYISNFDSEKIIEGINIVSG